MPVAMPYVCLLTGSCSKVCRSCSAGEAMQQREINLLLCCEAASADAIVYGVALFEVDSRAISKTSIRIHHVHATVTDQPGSQVITVGQSQTTARLLRQVCDNSLDPCHITWKPFVKFMVLGNDARVQMAISILCRTMGIYARRKAARQHHLSQGCVRQTKLACRLVDILCDAYV